MSDGLESAVNDFKGGRISRAQFVRRAAVLGVSLSGATAILAACGGDDDAAAPTAAEPEAEEATGLAALAGSGSVVVSTWGGSYTDAQKEALFDPFTAETGIGVTTTGTPDVAKMQAMGRTGNVEWDLVDAEGQMMHTAIAEDLLVPIDYDLVYKVVAKEDLIEESLTEYGFPSIAFGWVLAWNTKKYSEGDAPSTWSDFWDVEKFPDRRALYSQPKPNFELALLADGVAKEDLYPIDMDRAFRKLDEIKSHIDIFYEDLGQVDPMLQNSEVDLLLTSNGRAHTAKQKGFPVDYTFNEGGWEQGFWVVMGDSPNPENAMRLIAYSALPEGQAKFAELFAYGGSNRKSYDMMDPDVAAGLPTSPENLPRQFQIDTKWWTDNLEEANERWLEWRQAS